MKPRTRYTKSGKLNIAYQVIGEGKVDLVYVPGWVSHIDMVWDDPKLSGFLKKLTQFSRLILFDKRGTGLSDRVSELSTLEERMDDICAVMDAAGSERAVIFGHSEGGTVSCLFAATYPQRTVALITFGVFAKRIYSNDYPWRLNRKNERSFTGALRRNGATDRPWGSKKLCHHSRITLITTTGLRHIFGRPQARALRLPLPG